MRYQLLRLTYWFIVFLDYEVVIFLQVTVAIALFILYWRYFSLKHTLFKFAGFYIWDSLFSQHNSCHWVFRTYYNSFSVSWNSFHTLFFQCSWDMGFLSSGCSDCNPGGNQTEVSGTTCLLWDDRNHARYNHGSQCLWERTRRAPNAAIGSTECCISWCWWWILTVLEHFNLSSITS